MVVQPMRVGVLGCGMVSEMYLPNLVTSPLIDVVAVADIRPEVAAETADRHRIERAMEPGELLADASIELVVNLTPIAAHRQTTGAALAAGKHVYTEKTLATTDDDANWLIMEAERRGLALGCAPDTLLGSGFSSARRALIDGVIGAPLSASAIMLRGKIVEPSWYTDGALPFVDMAPYYVTALVHLFGPVRAVTAIMRTGTVDQLPPDRDQGAAIELTGVIDFVGGASATLQLAWGRADEMVSEVTRLDVFGRTGMINFPNPNNFSDPASVRSYGGPSQVLPGSEQQRSRNLRGLGVAEMVDAIAHRRPPRTRADVAGHVLEVINALAASGRDGRHLKINSRCVVPPPLEDSDRRRLLGLHGP